MKKLARLPHWFCWAIFLHCGGWLYRVLWKRTAPVQCGDGKPG
jgi:hypothetical protein